ncbi:uncharacterized protein [Centruroides vittatus]|uniref:uncharacterized protein n=1 Tax=Centruroides vittatus TaxID=120091 RepID=UPI00350EFC83
MEKTERKNIISFGTSQNRPFLPNDPPAHRLGITVKKEILPNLGPGSYNNDVTTSSRYQTELLMFNRAGWGFGVDKSKRFRKEKAFRIPSPTRYQSDPNKNPDYKQSSKPFGVGAKQRDTFLKRSVAPPPGYYINVVPIDRTLKKKSSFGGRETVIPSVIIRCTRGQPDICKECSISLLVDYYQLNGTNEFICRDCYNQRLQATDKLHLQFKTYHKVRECSFVHDHQGCSAAITKGKPKDFKKLMRREVYLNMFIS